MIRENLCKIHGWTDHNVSDDCYCLEDQGCGYSYSDEHGDCEECENSPPVCIKCIEEGMKDASGTLILVPGPKLV